MSKEEPRQQQPQTTTTTATVSNGSISVPNQPRHQQTSALLLNHEDQASKLSSDTTTHFGPQQTNFASGSSVTQVHNHTMAMHNFGPNSVNQDQLKNQQNDSPWHLNAKTSTNSTNAILNNNNNNNNNFSANGNSNNNPNDSQAANKSTISPSNSAFDHHQQPINNQQYAILSPQLPPSLQSSLASRVDQIIRNTLNDSPAYTPPTSNNSHNHHSPILAASQNNLPSPSSSSSMAINSSNSGAPLTGPQNTLGSNQNLGPVNANVSMSSLTSFHGSGLSNTGDTSGNMSAKIPAHSASHSSFSAAGSAVQPIGQAHAHRPLLLAHQHLHQSPFGPGSGRSPSSSGNSGAPIPQAAHGSSSNSFLSRSATMTVGSDHHNHIHLTNPNNQSDHMADFTSKLHNKMSILPPSRHLLGSSNWPDNLNQANENPVPRLPTLHGMNNSISHQPPVSNSMNSPGMPGSSSSMMNTSNSNPMIGQDSDNLSRLNPNFRGDQRLTGSAINFGSLNDGRGMTFSGPRQSYPGLEHFKVPAPVAETALRVQELQQRTGMANCIPETVAIFALNLTGANIPGTNKPKRVVLNDNEMRNSIEHGELYTKHESVVMGILRNQVQVPNFNIADYLNRDKFAPYEMEKIESVHSKIDPYQLICLMEFIRYRYPSRDKIPTSSDLNRTNLHQTVDSSDFRLGMNPRDSIPNSQSMPAPGTSNLSFSPISRNDVGPPQSRRSSQSPSDISRSQLSVTNQSTRPMNPNPSGQGYPNLSHPMSIANKPLMPSPYAPMNQQQKMPVSQAHIPLPMNRSSPFQSPLLTGAHQIPRPPRSHSTIGGTMDLPPTLNSASQIRQPPAAHQSSSRPNLAGVLDLAPAPAQNFNAPIAAHLSSKTPQTPRLQDNPAKLNPKVKVQPGLFTNKTGKMPTLCHLDQLGSPNKHHDFENHGLSMNHLQSINQQELANRESAMRRSITPHISSSGPNFPTNHPAILGPRGAEFSRVEMGSRSPLHTPSGPLGLYDNYKPFAPLYSSGMPPPSFHQSRLPRAPTPPKHNTNTVSSYQQLNVAADRPHDGLHGSNPQSSPGQAHNASSSNSFDLMQMGLLQRPPLSPKHVQRSIITGAAATTTCKKTKKPKASPPINSQQTTDPKVTGGAEEVSMDPIEKTSSMPTSDTAASSQPQPVVAETNQMVDPNDQLSQLAAAAAAAAPAVSAHDKTGQSPPTAIGETLQTHDEMLQSQTCEKNEPQVPTTAANHLEPKAAAGELERVANENTNEHEPTDGADKSQSSSNQANLANNAPNIPIKLETNSTPVNESIKEEPSKYHKLFTKKAWLKNYDQEGQSRPSDNEDKMAIKSPADLKKEEVVTKDEVAEVDESRAILSGSKMNGNPKSNKTSKIDSKKKSKANREKSSPLNPVKANRLPNVKGVENDSEETNASTSDLDDTTDEGDSMKSSGDKKLRRMPRRKVKINADPAQIPITPKPKSLKDASRKRVKKEKSNNNSSDNDQTPSSIVKRKYSSDDEGVKQKSKKLKDNNGKNSDKTGESPSKSKKRQSDKFLQTCPCYDIVPKNIRCMECRRVRQSSLKGDRAVPSKQTARTNWDDFCRFYEFRKLRYKSDQIVVAGFSEMSDAKESDKQLWLTSSDEVPENFDFNVAKFILSNVGAEFCKMVLQERSVQENYQSKSENKKITWKRAVKGLRELCDVCSTTLFNCHFVCERCGFVVCIDCHQLRAKQQSSESLANDFDIKKENSPLTISECNEEQTNSTPTKKSKKDSSGWIYCAKNEEHSAEKMILAQIIAGDCLEELWTKLHKIRSDLNLGPCPCEQAIKVDGDRLHEEPTIKLEGELKTEGSHSTLKGLLLASGSPRMDQVKGDQPDAVLSNSIKIEPPDNISDARVFDFSNEDDSQEDSRQVSAAIEECIASLSAKGPEKSVGSRNKPGSTRLSSIDSSIYTKLCDGELLVLNEPRHKDNIRLFREHWRQSKPVLVRGVHNLMSIERWLPQFFAVQFGDYRSDLVDCRNGDIHRQSMKKYWDGFEPNPNTKKKNKDDSIPVHIPLASNEEPSAITTSYYSGSALWRLKDWPPGQDFNEILPEHYDDFMNNLPLKSYTTRTGKLNLACRLPKEMLKPDLGPKMYSAYGTTKFPERGTTNLHLDISDAINVMVYVGGASSYNSGSSEYREMFEKTIDEANVDPEMKSEIRKGKLTPGALWHIFKPSDASKMREFLNKVADERKISPEKRTDPIHDQIWYLDQSLLDRLSNEYGVKSYPILQCMGDAILIPAGAPHQVKNLQNCIKVANDFVSPENVYWCLKLTDEFRRLPETHINQEDKLQMKNILYHSVKEALQYIKMYNSGKIGETSNQRTDSDSNDETDAEKTESDSDSDDTLKDSKTDKTD